MMILKTKQPDYYTNYRKMRLTKFRAIGLCIECTKEPLAIRRGKPISRCEKCIKRAKDNKAKRLKETGLCTNCGLNPVGSRLALCNLCGDQHNRRNKKHRLKLKIDIMTHYSKGTPKCACCGEQELSFLSLDHINNDGHLQRKKGACGWVFYSQIIKNPPTDLQVLCMNCQFGKKIKGICPHQFGGASASKINVSPQ